MWWLIIGAVAVGVVIVELAQRFNSNRAKGYSALGLTLLGTFAGFSLATVAANASHEKQVRDSVVGLLVSTYTSCEGSLSKVHSYLDYAETMPDSITIMPSPLGLNLPGTHDALVSNGEYFTTISPQLQINMPRAIEALAMYEGAYLVQIEEAPDAFPVGTLKMAEAELVLQMEMLALEIKRLTKEINENGFLVEFRAAVERYEDRVKQLAERDRKDGDRVIRSVKSG